MPYEQLTRIPTGSDWEADRTYVFGSSQSLDGRFITYIRSVYDPVTGTAPEEVFVTDLQTGTVIPVSVTPDGSLGNDISRHPDISADGRFVVFMSWSSDLVAGDANSTYDTFVRDLESGITTLVSTSADGEQGNQGSSPGSISGDGRYVAFTSYADNLVDGDTNGASDVFVKDLVTGEITLASASADGTQGDSYSDDPVLTGDGRFLLFGSSSSNLVEGLAGIDDNLFLKDLQTGEVTLVTNSIDGSGPDGESYHGSISGNGRYVLFTSSASNLVEGDTNGAPDVFVKDLVTGIITRVSTASDGSQATGSYWSGGSAAGSISADGRYVAFTSSAGNLVPGDTNGRLDVFVKDLVTGLTTRVSLAPDGAQGNGNSSDPLISADGSTVFFDSSSTNFFPGDGPYSTDIFATPVHPQRIGTAGADKFYNINALDTVLAGAGNDHIEIWSAPALVDGGAGNDLIVVRGSTRFAAGSLTGIEVVYAGNGTITNLYDIGYALTIKSQSRADGAVTVTGTKFNDVFAGGAGAETYFGGLGNDRLAGGAGVDRLYGGAGNDQYIVTDATDFALENADQGYDTVYASLHYELRDHIESLRLTGTADLNGNGNSLANLIVGNSGSNRLYGLEGDDRIYGNAGNDRLEGGVGIDRLYGGTGDDSYVATDSTDYAYEKAGEGTDTVFASVSYVLRENVERLVLTGSAAKGYGNEAANVLDGNAAANLLDGRGGDDRLNGAGGDDVLFGGGGRDTIEGGSGRDRMYGGADGDSFVFVDGDFASTAAAADVIRDFDGAVDRIDIRAIDAITGSAGDQSFAFVGTAAFSGSAGELRYEQIGAHTFVQGDRDGDGSADLWVRLDGLHALNSGDFVL